MNTFRFDGQEVFDGTGDDAGVRRRPFHGVGLATAGMAVGKDGHILALQDRIKVVAKLTEYVLLRGLGTVAGVKGKGLARAVVVEQSGT